MKHWLTAAAILISAACTPVEKPPPPVFGELPDDLPAACAAPDTANATRVHRVDTEKSRVQVLVYRSGRLERLGHNHVVSSHTVHGFAIEHAGLDDSTFTVCIPVNQLIVDDPQARAESGEAFGKDVDAQSIAATRRNMLGENQLAGDSHPYIVVEGRIAGGSSERPWLFVTLHVRDDRYATRAQAQIEWMSDGLVISGELQVRLTDLGIQPYTALFGALAVRDELEIVYRIATAAHSGASRRERENTPSAPRVLHVPVGSTS